MVKVANVKKKASMLLALTLASTMVLSACGSNNENKGSESTGGEGASGKPVTLKVEVFDRGNSPSGSTITKNYLTSYAQDNFGTPNNINLQYVPIPRSEEIQKLNVLMASGSDVPDIVFTYDSPTFYRYAQQGGLTELGELLDQYGPNLKKFLGEDTLAYGQYEGKQYALPAKRAHLGKYSSFIRQDWLDKLNLPVPQTTDELYNTLKAFKEKDPGQTGGKVIPLGMALASAQYEPLIWSFIQPVTEEQRYTLTQQLGSNDYPTLLPGFKDALQFMNRLYNEGLMSTDFSLDEDKKKLGEDAAKGLVGFFSEDDMNPFYADALYATLQKNIPDAKLSAVDVYTNSEGKHPKPEYAPVGLYLMIPKSSKNAVEAIKYLDWMASGDNLLNMQNGVEGENYTLQDGIPVTKADASDEVKNRIYNWGDMAIISNGKQLGDTEKNVEAYVFGMPEQFREETRKALSVSRSDTIKPVLFDRPIEAQSKYGTSLRDKFHEIIVKTTMVKPDQFDGTFESMMKDYMANGGQAILDERTKAYEAMK
ncbi:extracellular solute-binding protein [Paenibacillus harenae]|uniref:Aldouronate transport system substrate-binding protein n=1 Tax=Paenibacillus harenae TaxID=306543 RepID=A0ABT9TU73_PAEHA|nr:extracellular solute-binding protein [Paenibacillus harenae]MDQ0061230.1 putative aldouronate transport system substrate-binding protein [Paenibacillus harenae]MDQ0110900.1 putative aldouronate transport system substrate-binding protein [Paenibacillus harenae]